MIEIVRHENLVRKYVSRILRATLVRVYAAWSGYATDNKRLRALVTRILKKLNNNEISKGWTSWRLFVEKCKKDEFVINLFARRWNNLKTYKIFKAWNDYYRNQKFNSVVNTNNNVDDDDDTQWREPLHMSSRHVDKLRGVRARSRRNRTMSGGSNFDGSSVGGDSESEFEFEVGGDGREQQQQQATTNNSQTVVWGMDSHDENAVKVNKFKAKMSQNRERFLAQQFDLNQVLKVDRRRIIKIIKQLAVQHRYEGRKLNKLGVSNNILKLTKSIFVTRNFYFDEKSFHGWSILTTVNRQRRSNAVQLLYAASERSERSERAVRTPAGATTRHFRIARFAIGRRRVASRSDALFVKKRSVLYRSWLTLFINNRYNSVYDSGIKKLIYFAFSTMMKHTNFVKNEAFKSEVAEKTKQRLRIQAMQVMKTREHGLSIGRKVLDKLTSNRRTNILEKSFNALRNARERRVRGLTLIKRWCFLVKSGDVIWAFQSWKSKSNSAKYVASEPVYLRTPDRGHHAK